MNSIGNLLRKRISPFYLIVAALIGSIASVVAVRQLGRETPDDHPVHLPDTIPENNTNYKFSRLEGYKYVHPLYMAEPSIESSGFSALKIRIKVAIGKAEANHIVKAVSVYLKDFRNDDWMSLHPDVTYHPGSLFKLVTLTTYYRMAESQPKLMEEKWQMPVYQSAKKQLYTTSTLAAGKTYTVKELLYHMIVHNNTEATLLLQEHLNKEKFTQVFSDLQLPIPQQIPDSTYTMTAQQYTRFVSTLYESQFLPLQSSEAAISLLCQTSFKEGIVGGIPQGTIVAHKHGEASSAGYQELHETAIVYKNGQPYLLTIMTKGTDIAQQAKLVANISQLVWQEMNHSN